MPHEKDLKFSKEHEWIFIENNIAMIGISNFAQESLGDVVFIETPKVGTFITQNQIVGSVESVKTVSDIYSPISGEVIEINKDLELKPELLNADPYEKGWIYKMTVANINELDNLLSFEAYQKTL